MYLNFSNFRERTSAGGGTSLGPKMGTSVGWGGLAKFSPDGGEPPVPPSPPPGKKPCWPQMKFDLVLGTWPLTAWIYEGSHIYLSINQIWYKIGWIEHNTQRYFGQAGSFERYRANRTLDRRTTQHRRLLPRRYCSNHGPERGVLVRRWEHNALHAWTTLCLSKEFLLGL